MSDKGASSTIVEELANILATSLEDQGVRVLRGSQRCRLRGAVLDFQADAIVIDEPQHLIGIIRELDELDQIPECIMTLVHCVSRLRAFADVTEEVPWDMHLFLVVPEGGAIGEMLSRAWGHGSRQASVGVSILEVGKAGAGDPVISDMLARYRALLADGTTESATDVAPLVEFLGPLLPCTRKHLKGLGTSGRSVLTSLGGQLVREIRGRTRDELSNVSDVALAYLGDRIPSEIEQPFVKILEELHAQPPPAHVKALHRVHVTSFKSIVNSEAELGKTTIVIGGNATGKTSLVEAIEYALCRDLDRLSEVGKQDAKMRAVRNLTTTRSSAVAGTLDLVVGENQDGEFSERRLQAEIEDPGARGGQETPTLPLRPDDIGRFVLRQFKARRFVECKSDERGLETLALIGLPTDKLREAGSELLREQTPTLSRFTAVLRNAKVGKDRGWPEIRTSSRNVTKHLHDFLEDLANSGATTTPPGTSPHDRVSAAVQQIEVARREVAACAGEVRECLRRRESAPEDVVERLSDMIRAYSDGLVEGQRLTAHLPRFNAALDKIARLLSTPSPENVPQSPQAGDVEREYDGLVRKQAALRAITEALDLGGLEQASESASAKIARVWSLFRDQEVRAFTETVLSGRATQCLEGLSAVERLLGDLRGTLQQLRGTVMDAMPHLAAESARLAERLRDLRAGMASVRGHEGREPVAILAEVREVLDEACSLLGREALGLPAEAEPSQWRERASQGANTLKEAIRRLNDLDGVMANMPDLSMCREFILDIARGYRDGVPIGLLRRALAFDLVRAQQDLLSEVSDDIVGSLISDRYGVCLLEIVAALSPSQWAQPPLHLRYQRQGQRPSVALDIAAQDQGYVDAKYILNSAEASLLSLAWFIVGYLLHGQELSDVVLIDDPFMGLDPAHQDFAVRAVLRILRATCEHRQIVLAVSSQEAMDDLVRQIPSRPRRKRGGCATQPELPWPDAQQNRLPDVSVVTCSRVSKGVCRFSYRTTDGLDRGHWSEYLLTESGDAGTTVERSAG